MTAIVHRQCTLCEAHCGISVEVDGDRVLRITGDADDPFSRGYICPKAAALADLYEDPDRLSGPVRRTADGWEPMDWDAALDLAAAGLKRVQAEHGRDALATYVGNPTAHNLAAVTIPVLRHALGTRQHYSATSTDQLPQHRVSAEMFGNLALFPIPDLDRTDHLLILGANPSVSNGSIMTAPGVRDRLRAIQARGGRVVVVDPRRTETASLADEHVAVRPGGDPYLLLGMLNALGTITQEPELDALVAAWPAERSAARAGVDAATIARLAREFAAAPAAVAYGRVGVCQQETGTLTHWLINVLNVVTGNLDRPGGAMFTTPPVDPAQAVHLARVTGFGGHGRWTSAVTGFPEMNGELPVAGLGEEIAQGNVRGLLVFAGNPVLSAPGGGRLDAAFAQLDFMVAVDPYVTETTRHADVILPPVSPLERGDLDFIMPAVSVRNHVRYSPPAVPRRPGGRDDTEIARALTARLGRTGRALSLTPPLTMLDAAFAAGPHGVLRKGPLKGLTVWKVKRARHGVDLGPLEPRGVDVTLAPTAFLEAAAALEDDAPAPDGYDLVLIGRRHLRSNNSWMHNSRRLNRPARRDRCTALLHPDDAAARGLADGDRVRVSSRVGTIELPLEVSDEIRPGVVSIPHGFGHNREGVGWRTAAALPGPSVNDITDPVVVDRLTGNAAFNAVPVRVAAA